MPDISLESGCQRVLDSGCDARAALLWAMAFLHGGVVTKAGLIAAGKAWERQHGEPTVQNLLAWARDHEPDAQIVAPLVNLRCKEK